MSFTEKQIEIEITLGKDKTFRNGENTKFIRGLASEVTIPKPGMNTLNSAEITIYNIDQQDIDILTLLPFGEKVEFDAYNSITIYAGENDDLSVAFKGDISPGKSIPVYSGNNRALKINALTGLSGLQKPAPPTSISGQASVAEMVYALVKQVQMAFESSATDKQLADPYFEGSVIEQIRDIAEAAGIELIIDDNSVKLVDEGAPVRIERVPKINAGTSLIGYPSFSDKGLDFKCVYDPSLVFGGLVEVTSAVPKASGFWRINSIQHRLSCNIPGGPWESEIKTIFPVGQTMESI